jgi:hypothetical protein
MFNNFAHCVVFYYILHSKTFKLHNSPDDGRNEPKHVVSVNDTCTVNVKYKYSVC